MKKPKLKSGLMKLVFPLVLTSSLLNVNSQSTEEAGFIAAMNPYSQPNIHILEGREALDYYGSGDVNNDGVINFQDAELIRTTSQSGNDRADVNGDEVVDSNDANLIQYFVEGSLDYLPSKWNELNRNEKISWLEKMIQIDKTDLRPYIKGTYTCGEFARENLINYFGLENLDSREAFSIFAEDGDDNLRFNIPVYETSTVAKSGGGDLGTEPGNHRINGVLVGNNSLELNDWYFFEPQNDSRVFPGDWSMDENQYAEIKWFGYSPSGDLFRTTNLINFELKNGELNEITMTNPYLILENPNIDTISPTANFPNDKTIQYKKGMNLDSIVLSTPPTNVNDDKDPEPFVSHSFTTDKTNDSTYTDINFDIYVNWKIEDNKGNESNHLQKIFVRDTESPTAEFKEDLEFSFPLNKNLDSLINSNYPENVKDNSSLPIEVSYTLNSNQTSNETCSDVNYDIDVNWKLTDISGNVKSHTQKISVVDTERPTFIVPNDVYLKWNQSTLPDSTGKPTEVYDNSGLPLDTIYNDQVYSENDLEKILRRTWTLTDVCSNENSQDQYLTLEKPTGIKNSKETNYGLNKIYPVPTNDKLNLEYELLNSGKVSAEIYDTSGKLIDYTSEEGFTGKNKLDLDVSDLKPGIYILNFTEGEKTYTEKFLKK